jgi:molybdopterin-binding protein
MKLSSRNVLKENVKKVNHGAVNEEVIVGLPHGYEFFQAF